MIDPETEMLLPKRQGVRTFDDGNGVPDDSAAYRWATFSLVEVEAFLGQTVVSYFQDHGPEDLANALTGWHYFWSGAGRGYGNVPFARLMRSRVLVTQRVGLDI